MLGAALKDHDVDILCLNKHWLRDFKLYCIVIDDFELLSKYRRSEINSCVSDFRCLYFISTRRFDQYNL